MLFYRLLLNEANNNLANSSLLKIYIGILGIYVVFQFFVSLLLQVPAIRGRTQYCDNWAVISFIKWMHQVYLELVAFVLNLLPLGLTVHISITGTLLCWTGPIWRNTRLLEVKEDIVFGLVSFLIFRACSTQMSFWFVKCRYVCFWLAVLGCKFTFSYFLQVHHYIIAVFLKVKLSTCVD